MTPTQESVGQSLQTDRSMGMRIAVVGVGVVGSYFGGALARGGKDVVFVARGATSVLVRSW
jgi:hypothetical protein